MATALAILSNLAGLVATLAMIVLLFAGMPNSSPQQLAYIRNLMILTAAIGLICPIVGVYLVVHSRAGPSALVGALPITFAIGLFIYLLLKGQL